MEEGGVEDLLFSSEEAMVLEAASEGMSPLGKGGWDAHQQDALVEVRRGQVGDNGRSVYSVSRCGLFRD